MNAVAEKPSPAVSGSQSPNGAPASKPAKSGRFAFLRPVLLLVVLGLAVLTANWWFAEGRYIQSTDNAYVQGDIAVLGPRIEGDVIAVHVADNQAVKAGDRLISFDPSDREALLVAAQASEGEARAGIEVARRVFDQSRAAIAQAAAAIAAAEAEVTRAGLDSSRSGALVGAGWTSRQTNERAVADRLKADAALASAKALVDSAQEAKTVAAAQLAQAQAKLATAAAQVRIAANNLSYTTMLAPFDGVIGNRSVRVGQHVLTGQQLIAVAPPASQLYVSANFKETQIADMRAGQIVLLTPDIDSHATITGRVNSLAPATGALFSLLPPENATGNFTKVVQRVPVRIVIDPNQGANAAWLRAGLSVTAEVDTRGERAVRYGFLGAALHRLGLR